MDKKNNIKELSDVERIKDGSNFLRGTITEGLKNPLTGSISKDDTQLTKFHGIYQQHDRDLEAERKKQKLEPAYSFLIRVRLPGGIATAEQWIAMDDLSDTWANGTLKLTTRQAFQLHGVFKKNLKATIQGINNILLDTIAACGDVNRNVMSTPVPYSSAIHEKVDQTARSISKHLTPQTSAYHEIWLNNELTVSSKTIDAEPIYGKHYLPRKFKIGIAIPPYNDIDVYSQDLGFIAIEENGKLAGYNVLAGGGLGSTFGREDTYPRLGSELGFIPGEKAVEVAEKIVLVQKEHGNRKDRKTARLKYTIDTNGIDWFRKEVESKLGFCFSSPKPFKFSRNGDAYGWHKGKDGKWYLVIFIEGGRVKNSEQLHLKQALREIALLKISDFRLTPNQNLALGNIDSSGKTKINALLKKYGILSEHISGLRRNSIACVALNTCSLAFAEAERYLPTLISKIEVLLTNHNLFKDEIVIRMTGCPNGCGRPYLAEIGLIGKAPGKYNLYLGGNFSGERLNKLYKENINEESILSTLDPLLASFAKERKKGEKFGDFVIRKKIIDPIYEGKSFKH